MKRIILFTWKHCVFYNYTSFLVVNIFFKLMKLFRKECTNEVKRLNFKLLYTLKTLNQYKYPKPPLKHSLPCIIFFEYF
jgi:hypothetical protein